MTVTNNLIVETILVLGGNGYLGSKVVRRLVASGYHIICTRRRNSDLSRLSDINEKITWIPATIESVEAALQFIHIDKAINMQCNYGKGSASDNDVIEANVSFPLDVFTLLIAHGTKWFLTTDTCLPEELNMYSFSKHELSRFGKYYSEKGGIDFMNLKLQMFYGADEPADRFLPSVIRKMLNGEVVDTTVGTQHRDIIAADDVVEAMFQVIQSDLHGYNDIPVGTGVAPAISDIIDFIWEKTGKHSIINKGVIPMRKTEPNCVADVGVMENICDWKPVTWHVGIEQMIDEVSEMLRKRKILDENR